MGSEQDLRCIIVLSGYDDVCVLRRGQDEGIVAALDETKVLSDDPVDISTPFLGVPEDPS